MKCLLCNAEAKMVEPDFPGYQGPDKFAIYDCRNCNTQFSFPRIETSQIYERIYANTENVPGYDRYYRYKNKVKKVNEPLQFLAGSEEAYWAISEVLKQDADKKVSSTILEVGCGMGYLTYSLQKAGYNAIGLDISQNAVDEATKNFGNLYVCADVFVYANTHREEYDKIILTQVIEHTEEPVKWLETLMIMLKGGGEIILTTENKSVYPENTVWQSDLPPVHLWWFSEQSMEYIAKKLKIDVSFVDFSKYGHGPCGANIHPVSHNGHIFCKDGEINRDVAGSFLYKIVRKSCTLRYVLRKLRYIYSRIRQYEIAFGHRRNIMGVVFTKC